MPRSIQVKSMLNKTKRRDDWFLDEYTINPYSGCSFNCLYCYIRGSKYGEHMEETLSVKANAEEVLDKQLKARAAKGQYGIIVLASATDPYLQVEKELGLTRRILELIRKHRFPLHVITKSDLVSRDFDILEAINQEAILPPDLRDRLPHKVFITFSFSTLDAGIAKIFEPGAPAPERRLAALREALGRGFHSGVSLMPSLPFITDTGDNLESMFRIFQETGVRYIFPATLTLYGSGPADSLPLMLAALEKHYPHLVDKYRGFFTGGSQMPAYYRDAFYRKTEELCEEHGLKNRIL